MKKIVLLAGLILAISVANARIFVGGALGFGTANDTIDGEKTETRSNFTIAPEIGYVLSDKFDVGVDINLNSMKTKDERPAGGTGKTTGWGINPFVRYSFMELGKFKLKATASFGLGGEKTTQTGTEDLKSSYFGCRIRPYIFYGVNKHIAIFAGLNFLDMGYSYSKQDRTSTRQASDTSGFYFGANAWDVTNTGNFQIGFEWHF